jgi:hypothetical protein
MLRVREMIRVRSAETGTHEVRDLELTSEWRLARSG